MSGIGKYLETEIDQCFPTMGGGKMMTNVCRVSFWGCENIVDLVVIVSHFRNIVKTTDLYTSKW